MGKADNQCDNKQNSKWKMRIGKVIITTMMGVMGLGMISSSAGLSDVYAKTDSDTDFVVSDNWLEPAEIHVSNEDEVARRGAALPASYDARVNDWVTPVKDQEKGETCWAFASLAAMESNLIKNGKAPNTIDLSENQFAYFFYNRQTDKLGYTKGDYNRTLRGDYLSGGGTLYGSGLALTTWAGVTTEDRSPYMTRPSADLCYANDYSVKNVYMYDYDINRLGSSVATIKQAILDHGAVASGIYMDGWYYDGDYASYYCPEENGNHAVTIVGWDDAYPKENFNITPYGNGAWIVKNSYGTEFGDDGYYYVSYEDASLAEMIAFEVVTKEEQYDNNYQHDGTANPIYSYNKAEWCANVFTAKGASGYNEELKAVGIFTLSENTRYEIQIYTGLTSAGKPTSGTKVFSSNVKGSLAEAGFHTITLPKAVSLTEGEKFSVLVKLTDTWGEPAYMGVDSSYRNGWINFIAATGKNQSFVKVNGKWYDFAVEAKANVRIKAYTDKTTTKSNFKLSSSSLGVSKSASDKLSLKTGAANVYRNVTWKSSNTKVATVNSKGNIKGREYGTVTISATFVGSSQTKTLKCSITVGPSKIKNLKVSGGKKLKVKWKKNGSADGYEIYYAASKDGTYKKLTTVSTGSKTSYSKKLKKGTYYVKMRPYKLRGKTKLYGSFTSVKNVQIK